MSCVRFTPEKRTAVTNRYTCFRIVNYDLIKRVLWSFIKTEVGSFYSISVLAGDNVRSQKEAHPYSIKYATTRG